MFDSLTDTYNRLGGNAFEIVSAECSHEGGDAWLERVRIGLAEADIQASVELAMRDPSSGIGEPWKGRVISCFDALTDARLC